MSCSTEHNGKIFGGLIALLIIIVVIGASTQ